MRSLEQLAADWLEEARVLALTKDDFPAFIVLYPRGSDDGHSLTLPFANEQEKYGEFLKCQIVLAVLDIDRYVFVSQVWLAQYEGPLPPGRKRPAVMPMDRPDRRELIFVIAQHEDDSRAIARAEIVRDGEVVTGVRPIADPHPDMESAGDLFDFFKPPDHVREHIARCRKDDRWVGFVEGLAAFNVKIRE